MKEGDKVMIYQRPATRGEPEGTAILVEKLENFSEQPGTHPSNRLERWKVKFISDGMVVDRWILPMPENPRRN